MRYSPDAYLLHEANKFVTFNLRIKVVMKENVNPTSLKTAAEKAFGRFPYYHKQIFIDQDGGIDLIPNPRPIRVNPVSKKRPTIFSEESNYQPCSIEYQDECIFFNMYHGMCGGCGTFRWVKTTIYEYICTQYEVHPDPGTTILVDSPVAPEEYAFPSRASIPADRPTEALNQEDVWFPGLEYLFGFGRLLFADSVHHEFLIPKTEMMRYASDNNGSPMSVMTAVIFKALGNVLPKNKLPLRGKSNHNFRAEVGRPETHHDLLSFLFFFCPNQATEWSVEKLCTSIREETFLQNQPEYAYDTLSQFYDFADGVDRVSGLKEKNRYASRNSQRVPKIRGSFNINYTGKEDWGGMTEYVESVYVITDAHLLMEIADVGEHFCISLMQLNRKKKYLNNIFRILEEEKLPYTFVGTYKNHLALSKLESAPILGG